MKYSFLFFLLLPAISTAQIQDPLSTTKTTDRKLIKNMPMFSIYDDIYFITGTAIDESPNSNNSDGKFQLGFKLMHSNLDLPKNILPFLTYRQLSFWNIYQDSFPSRESNYYTHISIAKLLCLGNKIFHKF